MLGLGPDKNEVFILEYWDANKAREKVENFACGESKQRSSILNATAPMPLNHSALLSQVVPMLVKLNLSSLWLKVKVLKCLLLLAIRLDAVVTEAVDELAKINKEERYFHAIMVPSQLRSSGTWTGTPPPTRC